MTARATYRLQLHPGFGFADAAAALPYLAELGISHLYLSPVLRAADGSTHGYDLVDPDRVSDVLGGEPAFIELAERARDAGLAILLDIVPNHMSIAGTGNRWWLDVLENGPASYYAHFFDVDWGGDAPGKAPTAGDRVLLPILTERYGRALTSGQLAITHTGGVFGVRAGTVELPIAPRALGMIVSHAGERSSDAELAFIGDALAGLPAPHDRDLEARRRRHRDKAVLIRRLGQVCRSDGACARALDDELVAINTDPVELDAILEAQNYRLAHWSVAGSQLSYRRFFDITTLVGMRNEEPEVVAASHRRIFAWLGDGTIAGVRVDHVDGLRDPAAYLRQLRARAPEAWIVVEKILAAGEQLPAAWPVDGTTGYDFMERMDSLFVDPDGERGLTATFTEYTGVAFDPVAATRAARLEVMSDALHSELARLSELAARACAASPACRDYTRGEIEQALAELVAGYPTYRTYLDADRDVADRARIAAATTAALAARPDLDRDLLAFLDAALAHELPSRDALELAQAAQQITGSVVAKGDEDTVSYRQVRLLARCEVGADLRTFAADPDRIHAELAAGHAGSLLATSTHDTKRGEDVRARIAAISEVAPAWADAVARWRTLADPGWGTTEPDRIFEYAMWQTLVGAWPLSLERAQRWAEKAGREARLRTAWRRVDAGFEAARARWLERIYASDAIMDELARFAARLRPLGDRNSLAQTLIKLTAPGVPDFYQGSERRDDSLVDPDNRRPLVLDDQRAALAAIADARIDQAAHADLGDAKLWLIRRVLGVRRRSPELFAGPYHRLAAAGAHARRVFAFARGTALVTVVPRLAARAEGWPDTAVTLPPGPWRDALSERTFAGDAEPVAELWRRFPVALLVRA